MTNTTQKSSLTGSVNEINGSNVATITVPRGEFEALMNKYWLSVKDRIHPNIVAQAMKGGYRTLDRDRVVKIAGGVSQFYSPIALEIAEQFMEASPRQALVVRTPTITQGIESYSIDVGVELEPNVTWKKPVPGIDEPLKVFVPKFPDDIITQLVDEKLNEFCEKQVNLAPVMDLSLSPVDEQVVVVDVESAIGGERWEEGCSTAKKWPMNRKFFKTKEIYDTLLTMKPDERKTITFTLGEVYGAASQGKEVSCSITLIQVFNKTTPAIDDDLAKTYGFDSLETWRRQLVKESTAKTTETRAALVDDAITSALLNTEMVDVEPVPQVWMATKAKELFEQAMTTSETEESVVSQFAAAGLKTINGYEVNTKDMVILFLAEKSAQQLVADLVFKAWGVKKGLAGSTKFDVLPDYVKAVGEAMKAIVEVEEYEPTPIPNEEVGE